MDDTLNNVLVVFRGTFHNLSRAKVLQFAETTKQKDNFFIEKCSKRQKCDSKRGMEK